jgi:hypothetical protein
MFARSNPRLKVLKLNANAALVSGPHKDFLLGAHEL